MFLLVLDVSDGFEVECVAVVGGDELQETLGDLCVGLGLEVDEQFV